MASSRTVASPLGSVKNVVTNGVGPDKKPSPDPKLHLENKTDLLGRIFHIWPSYFGLKVS